MLVEHLNPSDPAAPHMTATFYWEKAYKDQRLLPAEKYKYVMDGIAATDRALALKPDYMEALTYKNLLLRMRAKLETDPVQKQQLIAEADALRTRAIELNKQRAAINGSGQSVAIGPMPPPPPPPPAPAIPSAPSAPVRVGGNIKTPTKVKDVRPMYPPDAQAARIQGVVIIEATIDADGRVSDAKILRSIPDAGRRRAGGRAPVGIHADLSERRRRASDHDRHGEFHVARLNSRSAIRDPGSATELQAETAVRATAIAIQCLCPDFAQLHDHFDRLVHVLRPTTHSRREWKLCSPAKRFGVGRPMNDRRDPSVPPRIGRSIGSMPASRIARRA